MDTKIIICFGCRRRVTQQEIRYGGHDHKDQEEQQREQQAQLATGD